MATKTAERPTNKTVATEGVGHVDITVPCKALRAALSTVGPVVARRSSVPILANVLLRSVEGAVSIVATDTLTWAECRIPAEGLTNDGATTVSAATLANLIGGLPDAPVTLRNEGDKVDVRCSKSKYGLLGLPADEFPLMPDVVEEIGFTLPSNVLSAVLDQVSFAASQDESRMILNGVLFEVSPDAVRLVATDTHRLAVRTISASAKGSGKAVVPNDALAVVQKAIDAKSDSPVTVSLTEKQVRFDFEADGMRITVTSRVIDGQFPNYERIIPSAYERTFTFERAPLLAATRRAVLVAKQNANKLTLLVSEDGQSVQLYAQSGNIGNASEEVEIATDTPGEYDITFNAFYLADVLGALACEGVTLSANANLKPACVKMVGQDDCLCILMPMERDK